MDQRKEILNEIDDKPMEELRNLPSCVKYLESLPESERNKMEEDDDVFKEMVFKQLEKLDNWYHNFCISIRVLHKLVHKLPGSPLGRQVRELYSNCLSESIMESSEFQESWKILSFSGRDELETKLKEILNMLQEIGGRWSPLVEILRVKLESFVDRLQNVNNDSMEAETDSSPVKPVEIKPSDRFHLREKLLGGAKQRKIESAFEVLRDEILSNFENILIVNTKPPNTRPFHEIFFFDAIGTVKYQLLGSIRATITTGLNNPHKYLQCSCCKLEDTSSICATLPDISVCYKLHLECGRLINLYDWMQAFFAVIKTEDDSKGKKSSTKAKDQEDEKLQARFVQAVSELQLLGFIKPTKRKTDHVQRLTWGGC